jgi:hypothetical protein
LIHQKFRAEVRGHDDQRVAEIDGAALTVGQAAVIEHLQQDVEDVGMRLLDLVEQHDLVGPTPHGFGQRTAFVITDIAGRRADQPRDRVLLHELGHVEADHRGLVVEQVSGERFCEFGLADAGRAQEHERAGRPVRVLQARAGAAHGGCHRTHGFGLADDALGELSSIFRSLSFSPSSILSTGTPVQRETTCAMWSAVTASSHHRRRSACRSHAPRCRRASSPARDPAIGQLARLLEFALALRIGQLGAKLHRARSSASAASESLFFSALPARRQRRRSLLEIGQLLLQRLQAALGAHIGLLLQRLLLDLQPDDVAVERVELFRLESTCIFSRAAASSIRSIALSGRKRSVM